ncbi:unnamed protein product [Closterium sp. NIES-65]|nr:unnamed protein product [Closterium sp. NIES-65]
MDKYELRWGRVFSRREEERARGEPSRERGRSLERSPRRPAFRADRVPVAGDRRAEGRPSVAAGGEGYAASTDGDVWRRGHDRGDGYGSGDRRAVGVFRSPEERGRRRDERGHWQGVERFDANQGGEAAEKEEAWETSGEEEAEEDAANLERAVEDANGEDDGEEPAVGLGSAEPEEADVAGGASQAGAEGSRSGRSESRGRDASRQEEHYAERSRQQERRDWGVHAGAVGTQGEHTRGLGRRRRTIAGQAADAQGRMGGRATRSQPPLAAGRRTRGGAQLIREARPAARGARRGGTDVWPASAMGEEGEWRIPLASRPAAAGKRRRRRQALARRSSAARKGRSMGTVAREAAAARDEHGEVERDTSLAGTNARACGGGEGPERKAR